MQGPLIGVWAVLVFVNYLAHPVHVERAGQVRDMLRYWSRDLARIADQPGMFWSHLSPILPQHLAALGAAAAVGLAGWLAGRGSAGWLRVRGAALRLALGVGAAGLAVLGAGLAGLLSPGLLAAGGLALAGTAWGRRGPKAASGSGAGNIARSPRGPHDPRPLVPGWAAWGCLLLAALSAALNLLGALAPETGYDSLIQHLADPRDYLDRGRIHFNDLSFLAQHPAGIEMLYLPAIAFGGDAAAKVVHWGFAAGIAGAFHGLARRHVAGRDAAALAAAVYLVPFHGILAARAYVDLGLAFFAVAALAAPWGSAAQGAVIGLAIGAKYLGGWMLIAAAGALLLAGRGRGALRVALGASVVAGCWGLRNWWNTGNPVYPFGWAWLGGLGWDAHSMKEYGAELASYARVDGAVARAAIPWLAVVRDCGALDDGSLGPLVLMAAPVLWIGGRTAAPRERRLRTAVGLLWLLWLASPRQVRYALMLLPPTFAAMLPALAAAGRSAPGAARVVLAGLPLVLVAQLRISAAALYLWVNPLYPVLGLEPAGSYLSRILEPRDPATGRSLYYGLREWLPGRLPASARTYMLGDAKVYYLPGRWTLNALFNPPLLKRVAAASPTAGRAAIRLRQRGLTHVLYNVGGSIHIEHTHGLFAFTPREFGVVEALARGWWKPLGVRETSAGDPIYLLFELRPGRHPDPPYLPGLDTRLAGVEQARLEGRLADAAAMAAALRREYPDSGWLPGRLAAAGKLRPTMTGKP